MRSVIAVLVVGCGSASSSPPPSPTVAPDEVATPTEVAQAPSPQPQAVQAPTAVSFPATCEAIARDIETLRTQYPQLTNYRAVDQSDCHVSYEHETLPPSGRGGGYSAGIPRPTDNGIFLYIGIWDPNGKELRQLDTQPMTGNWWIGNRRVTLLVHEGAKVKPAAPGIRAILERHGMALRD